MKDDPEGFETDEDEEGGSGGKDIHTASAGQTDGGGDPETGGGGQTADGILVLLEDNGACTDETDTGYHLGGHTRHVPAVLRGAEGSFEAVGRDNHKQGRTEGHEEVGAETGLLGAVFTFKTDGTAQQCRHEYSQDKFPSHFHDFNE